MKKKTKISLILLIMIIVILLYLTAFCSLHAFETEANQSQELFRQKIQEFIEFSKIPIKLIDIEFDRTTNIENIGIIVENIIDRTHFIRMNGDVHKADFIPLQKLYIRKEYPQEYKEYKNFIFNLLDYGDIILRVKWNFFEEFVTLAISGKNTNLKYEPLMYLYAMEVDVSNNPHHKLIIRNGFRIPVIKAELFIDIEPDDGRHIETYNHGIKLKAAPLWKAKSMEKSLIYVSNGIECVNSEAEIIWASALPKFKIDLKKFSIELGEGFPGSSGENTLYLRKCSDLQ